MHEFFTCGWLHEINRQIAYPHGVVLALELNDDVLPDGTVDDGTLVHGWHCVPLESAGLVMPPFDARLDRMIAFQRHIAEVRAGK
jgi:hypothetical protein